MNTTERNATTDRHQPHHQVTHEHEVHERHEVTPLPAEHALGASGTRIDIGIDESDRTDIAEGLSRLLADTYTLYLKTHNHHWNVTGPMFQSLHHMFETQCTELALAVDEIAERIRTLSVRAPASCRDFARLSSISEDDDQPDATEMIRRLVQGQEAVVRTARSIFPVVERGPRRTDRRSAHTTHADPREDRLDAPQPPRALSSPTTKAPSSGSRLGSEQPAAAAASSTTPTNGYDSRP